MYVYKKICSHGIFYFVPISPTIVPFNYPKRNSEQFEEEKSCVAAKLEQKNMQLAGLLIISKEKVH